MGVLVAALLLGQVPQAAALDLPDLDKPVTVEIKRALLDDVLTLVTQQTGVGFSTVQPIADRLIAPYPNQKVTIYYKDRPAKALLAAIADTLGGKWSRIRGRLYFAVDAAGELRKYLIAEDGLLAADADQRVQLLGSLVRKPFDPQWIAMAPPFLEGTASEWAAKAIRDPAWYAAGVCRNRLRINLTSSYADQYRFAATAILSYRDGPRLAAKSAIPAEAGTDDSAGPEGGFYAYRFLAETGEVECAAVRNADESVPAKLLKTCYRSPVPDERIRSQSFAKKVLAWPADPPEELTKNEVKGPYDVQGNFQKGRFGLADVLEDLHRRTGATIVADDYRVPCLSGAPGQDATNLRDYLIALRDQEKCFIRFEDGIVRVRHPAFWRLRRSEPDERSTLALESLWTRASPGLLDYAAYAYALVVRTPRAIERLRTDERFLSRFEMQPLLDGYPGLATLGSFDRDQTQRLVEGETYNTKVDLASRMNIRVSFDPHYLSETARIAVLYRHTVSERYSPVLEAVTQPRTSVAQYIHSIGRWDDQWEAETLWRGTDAHGAGIWPQLAGACRMGETSAENQVLFGFEMAEAWIAYKIRLHGAS